jgi:gliding motility-associated-like protein
VLDSCGFDALESNELKTIWLTVTAVNEENNQLDWNAFEGWDGEVEKYLIYRMVNNVEPAFPFDSVDGQTFQYTDDLSSISNLNGPVIYWVQAVEEQFNSYGIAARANSNRTGVALESEMFVANAFQPLGYTREFKPVFRFYNGRNYVFQIYNRWGELIFETYDPYDGWDGRHKDNYVKQGTYIYRLVYQNLDDSYKEIKGTVTVVY